MALGYRVVFAAILSCGIAPTAEVSVFVKTPSEVISILEASNPSKCKFTIERVPLRNLDADAYGQSAIIARPDAVGINRNVVIFYCPFPNENLENGGMGFHRLASESGATVFSIPYKTKTLSNEEIDMEDKRGFYLYKESGYYDEIVRVFGEIKKSYAIEANGFLCGGFSGGGAVALRMGEYLPGLVLATSSYGARRVIVKERPKTPLLLSLNRADISEADIGAYASYSQVSGRSVSFVQGVGDWGSFGVQDAMFCHHPGAKYQELFFTWLTGMSNLYRTGRVSDDSAWYAVVSESEVRPWKMAVVSPSANWSRNAKTAMKWGNPVLRSVLPSLESCRSFFYFQPNFSYQVLSKLDLAPLGDAAVSLRAFSPTVPKTSMGFTVILDLLKPVASRTPEGRLVTEFCARNLMENGGAGVLIKQESGKSIPLPWTTIQRKFFQTYPEWAKLDQNIVVITSDEEGVLQFMRANKSLSAFSVVYPGVWHSPISEDGQKVTVSMYAGKESTIVQNERLRLSGIALGSSLEKSIMDLFRLCAKDFDRKVVPPQTPAPRKSK